MCWIAWLFEYEIQFVKQFNSTCLTVKYSLGANFQLSSGFHGIHDYMVSVVFQGVTVFYIDDTMTTLKVKHDWMKEFVKNNSQQWKRLNQELLNYKHILKSETEHFSQSSNQSEGMCCYLYFIYWLSCSSVT